MDTLARRSASARRHGHDLGQPSRQPSRLTSPEDSTMLLTNLPQKGVSYE
jgi:hypothetical protein